MVASITSGELMLMSETRQQFSSTKSSPKTSRAMATLSSARSGAVTEPMKGRSDSVMCAASMSRWRLFTATSTGSQTVPPEWWMAGAV